MFSVQCRYFVACYQVVQALEYLHRKMKVIHRDVKPSNILLNRAGDIKLCDYSISGYLVNSLAISIGVGFYPYMAVCTSLVRLIGILVFLLKNSFIIKLYGTCTYRIYSCISRPAYKPTPILTAKNVAKLNDQHISR